MAGEQNIDQVLFDQAVQTPEAEAEALAPQETPKGETPPPASGESPPPAAEPGADASIPSWRLREETEARRTLEASNRELAARLARYESAQRQQSQQQPNFFEDPEAAVRAAINAAMSQAFVPFAQHTERSLRQIARHAAESRFGEEVLEGAEAAFMEAYNTKSLDPIDYHRVIGSPNRYAAVVQWHKNHKVRSTVGDDPQAWFDKHLEERMKDPKFQATVLEKVRGGAASRPGDFQLPPTLSKSTSAVGNGAAPEGDFDNATMWAAARQT